jgi:hypothetical protein
MAKTRESRPKARPARASGAGKKRLASRKPADKPKSITAPPPDPLDDLIRSAAQVLDLPIEPQWLATIKTNLEVNLRMAAFAAEFALPDEADPAPIFTA